MHRTPVALPATLLLALAALAAPAQAADLAVHTTDLVLDQTGPAVVCIDAAVTCTGACDREGAGNACDLLHAARHWCDGDCRPGDPTFDRDHDLAPDAAERSLCGSDATRGALAALHEAHATCRSHADLSGAPDHDRDGTPDEVEPDICRAENDNTDLDGSCDRAGGNWTL